MTTHENEFSDEIAACTEIGLRFNREMIDRQYLVHDTNQDIYHVCRSEQDVHDTINEIYEAGMDESEHVAGRFEGTLFEWTRNKPLAEHPFTIRAVIEPRFEVVLP